jgi:hypothetical protein
MVKKSGPQAKQRKHFSYVSNRDIEIFGAVKENGVWRICNS